MMFNIKKFYMVVTLHLCVLCGSHSRQQLLPYTTLATGKLRMLVYIFSVLDKLEVIMII